MCVCVERRGAKIYFSVVAFFHTEIADECLVYTITHSRRGTHSTTSIADLQFLSEFRNGLHFCIECFILCREGSQVLHHGCSRPLQGTHQVLSREAREVREKERKKGVRENWEGQ